MQNDQSKAMESSGITMSHETAHQACLIGSLMFTGAMSYRAGGVRNAMQGCTFPPRQPQNHMQPTPLAISHSGSNPYAGPGGVMLAALGGVSSLYHLDKMLEWRKWEQYRIEEAERLLRQHYGEMERTPSGQAGRLKEPYGDVGKAS